MIWWFFWPSRGEGKFYWNHFTTRSCVVPLTLSWAPQSIFSPLPYCKGWKDTWDRLFSLFLKSAQIFDQNYNFVLYLLNCIGIFSPLPRGRVGKIHENYFSPRSLKSTEIFSHLIFCISLYLFDPAPVQWKITYSDQLLLH